MRCFLLLGVVTPSRLFLACLREVGYTFHVTDDTRKVVHILRVAMRALLEVAFVDVSALVADGIGDIEGEIVTAFHSGYAQELAVLLL